MLADGVQDSTEMALEYMHALIGDAEPASSPARREAFVRNVPRMIAFMEVQGLRFRRTPGYPDYYPDLPGGCAAGRAIESVVFDASVLGEWASHLPPRAFPRSMPMGTLDVAYMVLARRTPRGFLRFTRVLAHHLIAKARRQKLVAGGGGLVAQLLHQTLKRGIPVWLESPLLDLVEDGGRVTGVVVERNGRQMRVEARRAVHLGGGGFARNEEMRRKYHPDPVGAMWTNASPSDQGDAIRIGMAHGAATALMDEAWWGPATLLPDGHGAFIVQERSKPGSLIVDQTAQRYMNEACEYTVAAQTMIKRNQKVDAIPSFLIFDDRYRSRYPFGAFLPGRTPEEMVANGYFIRTQTIQELAHACSLDPAALRSTIERFNSFARSGVDKDFHRGENAYDIYYGDPRAKPNPTLGPIDKPPFYAVRLVPGDLGTKGGLLTDEHGRVLREDGSAIDGLYASGNTSASVMGPCYAGPGSTLAPAMTFSYLAMQHAAGQLTSP
jgi:3-oxosteroid 1-dehydrogenase